MPLKKKIGKKISDRSQDSVCSGGKKNLLREGDNPPNIPRSGWLLRPRGSHSTIHQARREVHLFDGLVGRRYLYDEKIMLNLLNHVINEYVHIYKYNMYI